MANRPREISTTGIHTSDGQVKAAQGTVYWIMVSAGATGGAFQLNDSTDDTGTDKISGTVAANSGYGVTFDPAVRFDTAIYADIPGTNVTLTVGYS